MRRLPLLACVVICSAAAFGQAAAEGALTHALSTATGTAVGKTLGNVTNQMATRVSTQLGQQTAVSKSTSKSASTAVSKSNAQTIKPGAQEPAATYGTTPEPPAGGSMIASVQGAAPQPACDSASADSPSKQLDSASKAATCPAASDSHPSEITLPAPK